MKRVLAALLLLLLFCACTAQNAGVAPLPGTAPAESAVLPSEAAPSPAEPEPTPADSVPDSEPEPDPDPEPEPYPFTEGPALSVEGAEAGTIVLLDQAYYLPLEALAEHLPMEVEPTDDGGLALRLHSRRVWLSDAVCWEDSTGALVTHPTPPICWEGQWFVPQSALQPGLGLTVLTDLQYPHVYVSDNRQYEPVPEGVCVPTLMYHAVSPAPRGNDELFVDPDELEKQLQYLAENGYTTITFEDLPRLGEIEKPVMLTFDDGYDDNYDYLFPLLQQYGMKATIFVITGYVNYPYYLTEAEIKEMSDSGLVSIQSHTNSHPDLDTLDEADTRHELEISWLTLARITGRVPFVLCYPTGRQSQLTRQVAAERYTYGLLMNGGDFVTGSDPFLIPRHYVSRFTDLNTFAAMIRDAG